MILLDPDMKLESSHGRRAVRGVAVPAPIAKLAKQAAGSGSSPKARDLKLPSARTLARFLSEAQAAVRLKGQVTVLLTTDAAIRKLNKQFRGKDKATDVLSFPAEGVGAEEIAGDLAISVTTAMGQAAEQGHALSREIKVPMLHGLLHLAGYDHETDRGQMARKERLLRGRLGLPQGLIERAGAATHVAKKSAKKSSSGAKAPLSSAIVLRGLPPPPPSGFVAAKQTDKAEKPRAPKSSPKQKKTGRTAGAR